MPPRSSPPSDETGLLDSWGRLNRKFADRSCRECGATFRPARESAAYCSRACARKKNGGQNKQEGPIWWTAAKGYIAGRIWVDGKRVHVRQHRWLMEQHMNRPLAANEDVHHINGIKHDNRIENLALVQHSDHAKITNTGRAYRRGYKLDLTPEQRHERAERMRRMRSAKGH